jgi:predicted PurR-regulated permease PerM
LGFRRWVSVIFIVLFAFIVLGVLLLSIIPILIKEIETLNLDFPYYYNYIYSHIDFTQEKLEETFPIISQYKISDILSDKIKDLVISISQKIPSYLIDLFSAFSTIVLIPMLVFFMLIGKNRPLNILVELLPSEYVETILSIIYEINAVLGGFVRGQLMEATFVGIMSIIVLSIFNINFALIIGITAGFANLIPYVGPAVGLILASIVAMVQYQDFFILLKIIPSFLIIQFLDNNIIQPLAIGQNVNLGPVTMVFSMLAASQVFGFWGILLAIPVVATLKTIFIILLQKYKKEKINKTPNII